MICNLPNIWIYHIVYTKRTKEVVMYRHSASIIEYEFPEEKYTRIQFTDKKMYVTNRNIVLKWYDNTDYICWDFSQRKHIFVKDQAKAIEIFGSKDFENIK